MIKQKGYNVFPDEVESHLAALEGVDVAEVIGMPHRTFDEGIVAFVRPRKGAGITADMVVGAQQEHRFVQTPPACRDLAAEKDFPITRSTKVDKLALKEIAKAIIEDLRRQGKWDAA